MKVLVTCPPMLGMIETFRPLFGRHGVEVTAPEVVQTLSEEELMALLPGFDGWIIGDDPATRRVFAAGRAGRLRAAVKWGIGVDNVDFAACADLGIPIVNIPDMFGNEVADIAMSYVTALARHTFLIDRGVRAGGWPKPRGISLAGRRVALVGYGDIGRATARRLTAARMLVTAYDPAAGPDPDQPDVTLGRWPEGLGEADFIVLTCSLTDSSRHLINADSLALAKDGVRLVNIGRGPVVDEAALIAALASGKVDAAALDVFEVEPLPMDSPLRAHPRCVFGSHNASNTADAVARTSHVAINNIFKFLEI